MFLTVDYRTYYYSCITMKYSENLKERARELRSKGYSLNEISALLSIAKSTTSLWTSSAKLSPEGLARVKKRQEQAKDNAQRYFKQQRVYKITQAQKIAIQIMQKVDVSEEISKLLCSFLYWAEGTKSGSHLTFMNSDPLMIQTFLYLLRKAYRIDETKLRPLIHIHEYHNETKLKKYWSSITHIPVSQFYKSYQKPHTKKRIKAEYQGSISIRYYDAQIARELKTLYNRGAKIILGA